MVILQFFPPGTKVLQKGPDAIPHQIYVLYSHVSMLLCVQVGGRSNYFHCHRCDMCLPNHLQGAHKCVEKVSRSNCPVSQVCSTRYLLFVVAKLLICYCASRRARSHLVLLMVDPCPCCLCLLGSLLCYQW